MLSLWCGFVTAAAHAEDLVIGMSAAFTGPSRSLGIELYRGSQAYFDQVNANGGVHGRRLVLKAYDDGYDPTRAISNTIRLVEEDDAFLLFNYVGTPTVTRVLPLVKQYDALPMLLFFPFTGAEPQRRPPYSEHVFNLRASYLDETAAIVERMLALGRERIAVFYQADAYGRAGWEGVREALRDNGLDIHAEATYRRGFDFAEDLSQQVGILRAADPDAIVAVCAYAACAALVRDARNAGLSVPIVNLSFSGSEAVVDLLARAERATGADYGKLLITSQVVPSYQDRSLAAVTGYRAAMQALGPALPGAAGSTDYQPMPFSFISLEGYLNARLLVTVLERLGPSADRALLREAAENLGELDLGIGTILSFGPDRHQASDAVFFTTLRDGHFVPLEDWAPFRKDAP